MKYFEHYKDEPIVVGGDTDFMIQRSRLIAPDWDAEFLQVDQEMLFGILLAADNLGIHSLVKTASKHVAGMDYGRSGEEIREIFGIPGDLTEEAREQTAHKGQWYRGPRVR